MHQVTHIMPPPSAPHQPYAAGPHRTPVPSDEARRPIPAPGSKRHASPAILVGESGSNLVLSRLQSWGIPAQPAMAGVAYDLIADLPDGEMIRIQVKTRSQPTGRRCSFVMTRGFYYSRAGTFRYHDDDFDIAAFVCLSINRVFFRAAPVHRASVRAAWLRVPGVDWESFNIALQSHRRRQKVEQLAWLAAMSPEPPRAAPAASPFAQTNLSY